MPPLAVPSSLVKTIPVKFIGLGEGKDDLKVFDIEKYIYGLFNGIDNE